MKTGAVCTDPHRHEKFSGVFSTPLPSALSPLCCFTDISAIAFCSFGVQQLRLTNLLFVVVLFFFMKVFSLMDLSCR